MPTAAGHLILVGLPGAGKSTVGRALAARLDRRFVDLDVEIERREGMTVAELFAERGEAGFRECERRMTEEMARVSEPLVLSTGGGWVTNAGVVALLRPPGRIIYLKVSPERALARLGATRSIRPLLRRPDPLDVLRRLSEAREALYEAAADLVIPTDLLTVQQVTDRVAELASVPGGR